jgi:hypothetical protein
MTQLAIDPRQYMTDRSTKIDSIGEATLELDSHTDTCVLDRDALIFLDYDRPVIVKGSDPSLGTKTYATFSGALAHDDLTTGKVYHLVINQCDNLWLLGLINCEYLAADCKAFSLARKGRQ